MNRHDCRHAVGTNQTQTMLRIPNVFYYIQQDSNPPRISLFQRQTTGKKGEENFAWQRWKKGVSVSLVVNTSTFFFFFFCRFHFTMTQYVCLRFHFTMIQYVCLDLIRQKLHTNCTHTEISKTSVFFLLFVPCPSVVSLLQSDTNLYIPHFQAEKKHLVYCQKNTCKKEEKKYSCCASDGQPVRILTTEIYVNFIRSVCTGA